MNKVIHYFWFGKGEKPKVFNRCLKSWKKYLNGWEIKEWNETNVDINLNEFTKKAYDNKQWAFVSDYFRCYILERFGGLYLDIDCELIKNPETLFVREEPILGFELSKYVASGLIMYFPNPHHPMLKEMIDSMESFGKDCTDIKSLTVVQRFTFILKNHGLKMDGKEQFVEDVHIYPAEYFCPVNPTWKIQIFSKNTYSLHHYYGSWFDKSAMREIRLKRFLFKFIHPINMLRLLSRRYL